MKDIALHILDIAQNSVSAGASMVMIELCKESADDLLLLKISDNGRGMDEKTKMKITDPYFTTRTSRNVGLGIPLLKHNAEQSGGTLKIESVSGRGTAITASFVYSHFDCPPPGDIAGVISILAGANPSMDFRYRHAFEDFEYVFDTREIKEVLEDVPLSDPAVIRYMKEMIEENLGEVTET